MTKKAEPQFKKLGPKFGKQVNAVAAAIKKMDEHKIAELEANGEITLQDGKEALDISLEDVKITADGTDGLFVSLDGQLPVALDITLTEELRAEGFARELVNRIQNMRKDAGFAVVDRIEVSIQASAQMQKWLDQQREYIEQETLAHSIGTNAEGLEVKKTLRIENETINIAIRKINT